MRGLTISCDCLYRDMPSGEERQQAFQKAIEALRAYLEGYRVKGAQGERLRIRRSDVGSITKLEADALADAVCQVFDDHGIEIWVMSYQRV